MKLPNKPERRRVDHQRYVAPHDPDRRLVLKPLTGSDGRLLLTMHADSVEKHTAASSSRDSLGSRETLACSASLLHNHSWSPSFHQDTISVRAPHSIVNQPTIDSSSHNSLSQPGRVHSTDGPSRLRPSASSDRVVDPSELRLDREYTTHTFDPGSEVAGEYNQYAHPPSDCNYSCNGEEGDPYVNGLAEPLQNEVFLDDLPGYGTDGVFQARTVHYDEVPDELTYQAEALYASLRDEIPKRKFGVHEYALERSPSDKDLLPCDDNIVPLPSDLSHEYLQLEQPTYAYPVNTMVARMTSPAGVRLSNDSGLNSDHSGQDSLQTNSEIGKTKNHPQDL